MLISNQDAVTQAKRLRAGEEVFDFLVLDTRAAKRYLSQCERREKQRATKQATKIALQMSRRAGISVIDLLGRSQGQPNRDVEIGKKKPAGTQRGYQPAISRNADPVAVHVKRTEPKHVDGVVVHSEGEKEDFKPSVRRLPRSAVLETSEHTPANVKEWATRKVFRRKRK
jgi:hypothetical protein